MKDKFILDACCSGRMFWFNKEHPNALYCDIRELQKGTIKTSPNFEIKPDKIIDFRQMDFPDKSFKLVVFDPPHLKSLESNSWVAVKYGTLNPKTWKEDILKGFNECWRVLDDYGILIFKWSKSHDNRRRRDVSIENLLKILPQQPLFGHPSGSKINTIWFCFMKILRISLNKINYAVRISLFKGPPAHLQENICRIIMGKNFVELFCGSGNVTSSFKDAGFQTWKTDIRKRKGICEPDLRKNILQLNRSEIPFEKVDVLWASPPCDVWSYAGGNFHWNPDGTPKTKKCLEHIEILKKTLELIDDISPGYFFIENPRGRLRFYKPFLEWLEKHRAVCKTLTYSSYGFPATKPTNIFTNLRDISFKELDKFGRGAKTGFKLNNVTLCQSQKVPRPLSDEIVKNIQVIL